MQLVQLCSLLVKENVPSRRKHDEPVSKCISRDGYVNVKHNINFWHFCVQLLVNQIIYKHIVP